MPVSGATVLRVLRPDAEPRAPAVSRHPPVLPLGPDAAVSGPRRASGVRGGAPVPAAVAPLVRRSRGAARGGARIRGRGRTRARPGREPHVPHATGRL